jgi:hypothetical protein
VIKEMSENIYSKITEEYKDSYSDENFWDKVVITQKQQEKRFLN